VSRARDSRHAGAAARSGTGQFATSRASDSQRASDRNRTAARIASATTSIRFRNAHWWRSRSPLADAFGLGQHRRQIDSDIRRKIDLVDDEQVAAQQPRSPLARNVVATGDVDDEDPPVDQIQREGRSQIVAAGLEQDQLDAGNRASRSSPAAIFRSGLRGSRYADRRRLPPPTPAGSIRPERRRRSASSRVTRSLVTTARSTPRRCSSGISASISAVLPDPTGPPIPTRPPVKLPRPLRPPRPLADPSWHHLSM